MKKIYEMGPLRLDAEALVLTEAGTPLALGARGVAVLSALVSRANEYVTKATIMDVAWPGLVVEEGNLAVQISLIRRALSLVPGGDRWIETLARRGYRFVGPAVEIASLSGPPSASDRASTNLPQLLQSFVGRERELAEIKQLLPRTHLLTLTGTGGIGKTRLALQAAAEVRDAYRDGVWFVDLAPLADPALVPSALAQVLRVDESGRHPITSVLCGHLRTQEVLLVLDNCEHVLNACAGLAEALLRETTRVAIIATSREPLRIGAERTYALGALPLPDPNADAQIIARSDAVQLFLERARQHRPGFDLQEQGASAVAEICVRLDGVPLALELAAARVAVLPVEQIVLLLHQRFRLLAGGSRSGLARHRTLRAMVDWSYELLDEAEKRLFARLSVFTGGWTLGAAETVGAGEALAESEVVYLMIALVEKSLVVVDDDGDRYRLLETLRQYAQERLNESDEGDRARTRHLDYYLALAEEADPELVGPKQGEWLERLDRERENFLAAHSWCDHVDGGGELGLRLVFALRVYLLQRGLVALGHRVSLEALIRLNAQAHNLARCRALWSAGELGYFMGRYGEAEAYAKASLEIAREIRNQARAAEALRLLGYIFYAMEDTAKARVHFQDALALSRRLGDKLQLSKALNGCAILHSAQGEIDRAEQLYEQALALQRELGNRAGVAIGLENLAGILIRLGFGDRAREMLREGIAIADEIGSKRAGVAQLRGAAELAAHLRDWKITARLYGATEAQWQQTGQHIEPSAESTLAPRIARARDALGAAAFAAAESAGRSLTYDQAIAEARAWLEQSS